MTLPRTLTSSVLVLSVTLLIGLVAACGGDDDAAATSTQCSPTLGTSPSGCPESAPAESAYANIKAQCGVTDAELDITDPKSPTLTAASKGKLCASCDCRKAVYAYETLYARCTSEDQANRAFARNLYATASSCK